MDSQESSDRIQYPPFCELCLTKFSTNQNAQIHFKGVQHYNRIMVMRLKSDKPDGFFCEICCCELNTQLVLEQHKQSPKHLKKHAAYIEIMQLKEEYLRSNNNINN
ncbi:unnamed protein product [Brachionus calyciflorus]|uniref:U1-type domain-containing protein n=1 Tax=Brachionus calyciflorus TaxID=104777 RepID=A0A814BHH7_9BILA|nr:unnamed protein product [Brachionus calyciflorus]